MVPKDLEHLHLIKKYNQVRREVPYEFFVYHVEIKDCTPVLSHHHNANLNMSPGGCTHDKIGCYVHGEKKDILEFMNLKNIYTYMNNDRIVGVSAICVEDIFRLGYH